MLPGEDGIALARELRSQSDVGIIMLTGRGDIVDRVADQKSWMWEKGIAAPPASSPACRERHQVILHPSDRLRDGIAVTPRD